MFLLLFLCSYPFIRGFLPLKKMADSGFPATDQFRLRTDFRHQLYLLALDQLYLLALDTSGTSEVYFKFGRFQPPDML
jgi:hypothetical protein